jgi:hypothetical protein
MGVERIIAPRLAGGAWRDRSIADRRAGASAGTRANVRLKSPGSAEGAPMSPVPDTREKRNVREFADSA